MPREAQTRQTGDPDIQKAPMHVMAIAFAVSILAFGPDAFAAEALSPGVPAALAGQSTTPRVRTPILHGRRTKTGADQTPAFSGVKPAVRVTDYVADGGYFTRLFSSVVGPKGHVYAVEPTHSSGSRASLQPSRSFRPTPWPIRT